MIFCKCLTKCVFLCLFALIAFHAYAGNELELINMNSNFEEAPDFKNWDRYVNPPALAIFDISKDAAEGKQCAHIDIREITGTNWHVGLTQDGLTLEGGQMYTVDFLAKADVKRIIAIELKRSPGQGDWEGITELNVTITENWEEYFHAFTPGKDYDQTAFFGFWLGQLKGEVWIDGVRIYEGKKQEREELVLPKNVGVNGKIIAVWATIKTSYL